MKHTHCDMLAAKYIRRPREMYAKFGIITSQNRDYLINVLSSCQDQIWGSGQKFLGQVAPWMVRAFFAAVCNNIVLRTRTAYCQMHLEQILDCYIVVICASNQLSILKYLVIPFNISRTHSKHILHIISGQSK